MGARPDPYLLRALGQSPQAFYEAARPGTQRPFHRDRSSADLMTLQGAVALRAQMRHLERNHDLVRGALDTLVNNTVGPSGIGAEFQPRRRDGSIHTQYRDALNEAFRDWCKRPEVTWTHSWSKAQRLTARTWFRDGEAFAQRIVGFVPLLDHGTRVPYSLELLEPDFVPMDYSDESKGIRQGIERDAWGRKRRYAVYKRHPGDFMGGGTASYMVEAEMKWIPADRMLHVAQLDRIGQLRGVTRFASVIQRLQDIKDYEESERIAAKVSAMLTAYVKRQAPDGEGYTPALDPVTGQPMPREIGLAPGTIIDTLAVGEEIGLIDSKRPNPNLVTFRQGQIRMFAAGVGASYSSLSRDYNGTYSAQRQELVEQWIHYACGTDDFVSMFVAPVVNDFPLIAHMAGVVPMPADLAPMTHDDVLYIAPSMPWIDPLKEAAAWLALVQGGFASQVEVIRKRGTTMDAVLGQIEQFQGEAQRRGLVFNSQVAWETIARAMAQPEAANA